MIAKWLRRYLVPILLLGLLASALWTYNSIKAQPVKSLPKEVTLSVIPEYEIISGKQLTVWPKGTTLPQGLASYFYAAEPMLILTPRVTLSGAEQAFFNARITSGVVLQAVDDKGQVYWQYPFIKTPERSFTLSQEPGGLEDQSSFAADELRLELAPAYEAINRISGELMFQTGTFQTMIYTEVEVSGEINGNTAEETLVQTLPITMQQAGFILPKTQEAAAEITLLEAEEIPGFGETVIVTIRNHRIPFGATAFLLLLLFLILVTTGDKSKTAKEHRRFREWITEGSVELKDRLQIHIHGLEGLVDLAIDLDRRVIYDSRMERYYVLTEDIVYVYDPENLRSLLDHKQQLGKLLMEQGLLSTEQLEMGLLYQKKIGRRLGESLVALGLIDETTLYSTLAAQSNLDYTELDPEGEFDTGWLDKLNPREAIALMALPLGRRADGRLVIASAEAARANMKETLREIFSTDIYLIAARPTAIVEALERINAREREKDSLSRQEDGKKPSTKEGLSEEELDRFRASYFRGVIQPELLLKAYGRVKASVLSQVPEKENLLGWLVNKNIISSCAAGLIRGLGKATEAMEFKLRQEKKVPSVTEIMAGAEFITVETKAWAEQEALIQGEPAERILISNFITTEDTVAQAELLIGILRQLLGK